MLFNPKDMVVLMPCLFLSSEFFPSILFHILISRLNSGAFEIPFASDALPKESG